MENQPLIEENMPRESGGKIHRRETNWQIYLPFLLGLLALLVMVLVVALPSDPIWRDRAQAIGDFLYTIMCIIPLLLCLLPMYILILLSVYGMTKIHDGTERPLRKLETLTEGLAERIEAVTTYINEKTIAFRSTIDPIESHMTTFDSDTPSTDSENDDEEKASDV